MTQPATWSEKSGFHEAERAQVSFLAPLEKRALLWMAHHTPPWINSDHLTALGLAALLACGVSYWQARTNPKALLIGALTPTTVNSLPSISISFPRADSFPNNSSAVS